MNELNRRLTAMCLVGFIALAACSFSKEIYPAPNLNPVALTQPAEAGLRVLNQEFETNILRVSLVGRVGPCGENNDPIYKEVNFIDPQGRTVAIFRNADGKYFLAYSANGARNISHIPDSYGAIVLLATSDPYKADVQGVRVCDGAIAVNKSYNYPFAPIVPTISVDGS